MTDPDYISNTPKRRCTTCGIEFPATLEYFSVHKGGQYGLHAKCRECKKQYEREHYAIYAEKKKATQAIWRDLNRELHNSRSRKSYHDHREKRLTYMRAYHQSHRNHLNEQNRIYHRIHRDRLNEYHRSYLRTPQGQQAHATGNTRRRARKRQLPVNFTTIDWQECLNYWHGCCAYCGRQANGLFSQVHQEHFIPLVSSHCPGTVRWNMLPSCADCNWSKKNKEPREWVIEKFGKRKGIQILKRIDGYFTMVQASTIPASWPGLRE